MIRNFIVLDVATAAIPDAAVFLEPVSAPSNYADPAKIEKYIADKTAERQAKVALDLDLAQVTGIGYHLPHLDAPTAYVLSPDSSVDESRLLQMIAQHIEEQGTIISYNGLSFDLPLLMRRARYLGIGCPKLNLDRYRSPHVDLCAILSDRDPQRRRPLSFYVRRMGWSDLTKTLDGAEEARVLETGRWDDLRDSLLHDVTATWRLAQWLGLVQPVTQPAEAEVTL